MKKLITLTFFIISLSCFSQKKTSNSSVISKQSSLSLADSAGSEEETPRQVYNRLYTSGLIDYIQNRNQTGSIIRYKGNPINNNDLQKLDRALRTIKYLRTEKPDTDSIGTYFYEKSETTNTVVENSNISTPIKNDKSTVISSQKPKTQKTGCLGFPYKVGCKNENIEKVQRCLGILPYDGILGNSVIKGLVDIGYSEIETTKLLTQEIYNKITENCKINTANETTNNLPTVPTPKKLNTKPKVESPKKYKSNSPQKGNYDDFRYGIYKVNPPLSNKINTYIMFNSKNTVITFIGTSPNDTKIHHHG